MFEMPKSEAQSVRPADALGTLSRRGNSRRVRMILIAVVALFVVAFLVGLLWRGASRGIENAPTVPSVTI